MGFLRSVMSPYPISAKTGEKRIIIASVITISFHIHILEGPTPSIVGYMFYSSSVR